MKRRRFWTKSTFFPKKVLLYATGVSTADHRNFIVVAHYFRWVATALQLRARPTRTPPYGVLYFLLCSPAVRRPAVTAC